MELDEKLVWSNTREEYNNETFWDDLVGRLTRRDLSRNIEKKRLKNEPRKADRKRVSV